LSPNTNLTSLRFVVPDQSLAGAGRDNAAECALSRSTGTLYSARSFFHGRDTTIVTKSDLRLPTC